MELYGQIRAALTAEVLRRASYHVGEEEARVRRAVSQIIPAVMAAAINFVSTETGAYSFLCMLQEGRHIGGMLGELHGLLSNRIAAAGVLSVGERAIAKILNDNTSAVVHAVAEECSLHEASAAGLVQLITMVMLGVLGREVSARKLEAADVVQLILDQRRVTARALPPEVAKIIDLYENPADDGAEVVGPAAWTLRKLKLFRLFTY